MPVSWGGYGGELDAGVPGHSLRRNCGRGVIGQEPDFSRHTTREAARRRFRAVLGLYEAHLASGAVSSGVSCRGGQKAATRRGDFDHG